MNNKIWSDSEDFKEFEQKVKIKSKQALLIYDSNFSDNFKDENAKTYFKYFDKIIYIQNNKYKIGCISKMDKKGYLTTDIYCLTEIDPETGEIIILK